ncbi:cell division protein [Croceivirga radicis]|uniref:Cell division protein n=1 Tax=Croceivirga radicis TaxID=1929488 RepID=A0A1V6LVK2_9FLAO|nr:ATP-binding protein [Croceivirga radicis]OQD44155.1 cell division protein [Croceivirga radicis]
MLESLLEALKHSPDNVPLKLQVAKLYLEELDYLMAEEHLTGILALQPKHEEAKYLLASCFLKLGKQAAAEIIAEELSQQSTNIQYLELLCECQLAQDNYSEAQNTYRYITELQPGYQNHKFDQVLKNPVLTNEDDFTEDVVSFMSKPNITFKDVGGMEQVKNEIDLKIIKPLQHQEVYKAYGKKIGGGILLYGPPGCGKTYLAKATAGQIDANFINVGINDILDIWLGSSEKNLHEIFEKARANTPCVIFIDEIDALGANRNDMNKTAGRTVINQFLSELDGVDSNNDGILIIGATNAPWYLDPAFRRPGRFDRIVFVSPPDTTSREAIFDVQLKNKPTDSIDLKELAKKTKEFSGADINAAIDLAIEDKLQSAFVDGIPKPLTTKDILKGIKKTKPSTKDWFSSARNYALYANDSGLYDDILTYLNIKK